MDSNLIKYSLIPEETYSCALTFNEVVEIIKLLAAEGNLSTKNDILVIEITEGVFIRSNNIDWSNALTSIAENMQEIYPINIISGNKWIELTRNYRAPLNSFGDERLVKWRIGFYLPLNLDLTLLIIYTCKINSDLPPIPILLFYNTIHLLFPR